MKTLEVLVEDASSKLVTVGAVFRRGAGEDDPPVVTHVIARPSFSTRFALEPDDYFYVFHVEGDGGAFTLKVKQGGQDGPIAVKKFDTQDGFYHRILRFRVRV